jgi:hypothetical protein
MVTTTGIEKKEDKGAINKIGNSKDDSTYRRMNKDESRVFVLNNLYELSSEGIQKSSLFFVVI